MPALIKTCRDFFIKSPLVRSALDYFNLSHMYEENADPEELEPMLDLEAQTGSSQPGIKVIPKIVHFAWIGSDLPEAYKQNLKTWLKNKEDYNLHLWIDSAVLPLEDVLVIVKSIGNFCEKHDIVLHDISTMPEFKEFTTESFYNDWVNGSDKVYSFAVDVLRLLILYRYGGVYSDIDTTLSQPLGTLANNAGFFAWGATDNKPGPRFIDGCVMASISHNPLFMKCLDQMRVNYKDFMICTKDDKGVLAHDEDWTKLVYNRRRFRDAENDGIQSVKFSTPILLKIASSSIEEIYGKQGIKDGVIERNVAIIHEAKRSWQASRTMVKRKRKGVQTTEVQNTQGLTPELAKSRGRLGFI